MLTESEAAKAEKDEFCKQVKGHALMKSFEYSSWHDPNNWRTANEAAIPHLHRIPCKFDRVVFPEDAAFKVSIFEADVSVSELNVGGRGLSTVEFRTFLSSSVFRANKTVSINGGVCSNPAG